MRRRYGVAVAALMLALQFSGEAWSAEPSLEELETISAFLDANDVDGLRAYLLLHPDFMQGESGLARLLTDFMEQSDDILTYLSVETRALLGREDREAPPFGPPDEVPAPPVETPLPAERPSGGGGTAKPPAAGGGTARPPIAGGGTIEPPVPGGGAEEPPAPGGGTAEPPDVDGGTTEPGTGIPIY